MTREEAKNSIDEIDFLTWQIDIINNTIFIWLMSLYSFILARTKDD